MNIKNTIISILILLFNFPAIWSEDFTLPSELVNSVPGKYDLLVKVPEARDAQSGVRAMVYLPKITEEQSLNKLPVIVFFHGNTKDKNYYKNQVSYMTKKAGRDKFILLSVQNWWCFTDLTESIRDSRRATNYLLWQLADAGLIRSDAVYTTGFSAGGLAALMTLHNSLQETDIVERKKPFDFYPYAGAASFKGNFYLGLGTFVINPIIDPETEIIHRHYQSQYKNKLIFFTVGGKKDAPRVQDQAPEGKVFFEDYLGVSIVYKEYPNEAHNLSEKNWQDFWNLVQQRM